MARASIVILTWNGREYLADCLTTALAQDHPDYEVIVVDNASTDGSADFVAAHFPQVRLIRNPDNFGFARGMNVGIRAATGEIVALLNQDAAVAPGWLSALDGALAGDPTVGIAGTKVLYPDRATVQHAGGIIRFPTGLADHAGYRQPDGLDWNQPADVDYVTGAAFAIRRDVLTAIGLFDEGFSPAYYEEADLCRRAQAAGFRVRYVPDAVAYHHESSSITRGSERYYRYFHAGRLRFVVKHWTVDQICRAFVPAELERLQGALAPGEPTALLLAYRQVRQTMAEIVAYRQRIADSTDSHSPAEREALAQAIDTLVVAATAAAQPPKDSLAEYHDRMIAHAGIAEPTFRSEVPIAGRLLVALRRAWNWMSTKWYVRPILQQQSQFNDAAQRAVGELGGRIGQAQTDLRVAALRLDAAERAQRNTHADLLAVDQRLAQAHARIAEMETTIREMETTIREMEATAAAMDRQIVDLTRELARLSLRVRRVERPDEVAAAQRLLDDRDSG